jgi:hypothetical protein
MSNVIHLEAAIKWWEMKDEVFMFLAQAQYVEMFDAQKADRLMRAIEVIDGLEVEK